MRIDVAFTPGAAPGDAQPAVAVVLDVLRATTTITYALAAGYREVLACGDIDAARALHARLANGAVLAGERRCVRPAGFDRGNSPREFLDPPAAGARVVLTTTNGTRAIVAAAERAGLVLIGGLANLAACAEAAAAAARPNGGDVLVQCAGVRHGFTMDDAYAAGRLVDALAAALPDWAVTDGAAAARLLAGSFQTPAEGLAASQSADDLRAAGLEEDVAFCARESVVELAPVVADIADGVATVRR